MPPTKEERIGKLVEFIGRVRSCLKIEAGELNSEVYNNPRIVEALNRVAGKVSIKVQASPVICVDENGKNCILELWKGGRAKLYLRKVRGDKIHRWIGDDAFIYSEDFHAPLANLEERNIMVLTEEQERYWARNAGEGFDGRIEDGEVTEVSPWGIESMLLLEAAAIRRVYEFFLEKGEDYKYKTRGEIDQVREELGIRFMPVV